MLLAIDHVESEATVTFRSLDDAMAAVAAGDRAAFDTVFEALHPKVSAFCRRYLQTEDVRDACQTVMLKLFEQAKSYDPSKSAASWALSIAYWECRTVQNRHKRRAEQSLDESPPQRDEGQFERRLLLEAIASAILTLSDKDQEAVMLSIMEQNPKDPNFRKRKQRAFQRLRDSWRRLYE